MYKSKARGFARAGICFYCQADTLRSLLNRKQAEIPATLSRSLDVSDNKTAINQAFTAEQRSDDKVDFNIKTHQVLRLLNPYGKQNPIDQVSVRYTPADDKAI